jgi:hypothetical protein
MRHLALFPKTDPDDTLHVWLRQPWELAGERESRK